MKIKNKEEIKNMNEEELTKYVLKMKIAESKAKIVAEVNRFRRLKKELRELGNE